MKSNVSFCIWVVFGVFFCSMAGMAQEVEPPLTWEGKGGAIVMPRNEIVKEEFQLKIHIDTDGWVTGKAYSEEGEAKIEKLYYSEKTNNLRKLILVLTLIEDDEQMFFLFDGRMIRDQLLYGEIFAKPFEKEGEVEKALNIGDKTATQIWEEYIPESLKNAKAACRPVGTFAVTGDYTKE